MGTSYNNRKAIVVGASSGIGKAIAIKLASMGYIVGITGRRESLLDEISQSYTQNVIVEPFDISDIEGVAKHLESLKERMGGVDLLIHCSGAGSRNIALSLEEELRIINTNILGFTAVMNWAFLYFQERGEGHLAAISSIAGLRGFALSPSYSSSKSFQMKYLEALRQKGHNMGKKITVTDIRAGFVDTDMGNGAGAFWQATPQRAANQIVVGINAKKDILYVTKRWRGVAWIMNIFPSSLFKRLNFPATKDSNSI